MIELHKMANNRQHHSRIDSWLTFTPYAHDAESGGLGDRWQATLAGTLRTSRSGGPLHSTLNDSFPYVCARFVGREPPFSMKSSSGRDGHDPVVAWRATRPLSVMYRRRAAYRCIAARVGPQAQGLLWPISRRATSADFPHESQQAFRRNPIHHRRRGPGVRRYRLQNSCAAHPEKLASKAVVLAFDIDDRGFAGELR